jgi:hypothetical protein
MHVKCWVIGVGLLLAMRVPLLDAQGGLIRAPAAVEQNTGGEADATHLLLYAYNQAGLSAGYTSGVTDFDTYIGSDPTHDPAHPDHAWLSEAGKSSARIDFDMGAEYEIARIALWNEPKWGIATVDVSTSNTSDFSTSTSVGSFTPTDNPSSVAYLADVFVLTEVTSARYVRLDVTKASGLYISMGEVAFDAGLAAIPEPSTVSALCGLVGMGLVGGWWRRRRS